MPLVVGDEETEEVLVLALLLVVEKGEDEAVVGLAVVRLPVFLAPIDESLFLHLLTRRHWEMNALPHLVVLRIEGTSQREDGKHVVVAFIGFVVMF